MAEQHWIFRENNLDFVRLIAAAQVAVLHSFEFMFAEKTGHWFFEALRLIPGVPIFFFISGYLISKSYEHSPTLVHYSKNRILRIYPALIVCVAVNIIMVGTTGYFRESGASLLEIFALFAAKSSFLQFYNPEFMREFGDGVLNGSLWTICVELQFYVGTPIIYLLFGKMKALSTRVLIILILISLLCNRAMGFWQETYSEEVWWKLYRVSFFPWIYMFFIGILFQRNFKSIAPIAAKTPLWLCLVAYFTAAAAFSGLGLEIGNNINPLLYLLLCWTVFRFAYTKPGLAYKALRGNDISYGLYIWHMPIVNQMLYLDYDTESIHAVIAIGLSVAAAILSWKLIEKPSLKLKNFSLHPVRNADKEPEDRPAESAPLGARSSDNR